MIYITGDTHGDPERFREIEAFCRENKTTTADYMIILGDAGINRWRDFRDIPLKKQLSGIPVTFVCVRGNHEARPEDVPSCECVQMFGGTVYREAAFPDTVFLCDGGEYEIDGKKILAIGGAYSVDKDYRIMNGMLWFENELLSEREQREILDKVRGHSYDIVLTHTCPFEWQPTELFLSQFDPSRVDKSMEIFLGEVERSIEYGKWYFGHFHGNKNCGRFELLYKKIKAVD